MTSVLQIWSHWPSTHILKGLPLLLSLNFEPSTSTSSYIERQIFKTRVKFELVILINTLLYVVNFSLLLVDMFHQLQDTCGHKGLCCKTLKDVTRIIVVFYFKNIFVWFETGYQGWIRLFQKGFQCIIKALLPDLFASFHFLLHLQSEVASGERKTFHWELHSECKSPLIVLCWLVVWQRRWWWCKWKLILQQLKLRGKQKLDRKTRYLSFRVRRPFNCLLAGSLLAAMVQQVKANSPIVETERKAKVQQRVQISLF